jgi:hypothetical protein
MIGAMVVAELALVAEVDDLPALSGRQTRGFLIVSIDRLEERRKGGAQGKAAAAVVTLLEDTGELGIEIRAVEELRIGQAGVLQGTPLETASGDAYAAGRPIRAVEAPPTTSPREEPNRSEGRNAQARRGDGPRRASRP